MRYREALIAAMQNLAKHDKTLFIGQSVKYGGTGLYDTLIDIDERKTIEWPVAEYLQMGATIGLAIEGFIPVSLFPRWNFLLMGADQIVNHLDKLPILSQGRCTPKVIIRVSVGSETPVDPQAQHKGDFTAAFSSMCSSIDIIRLDEANQIIPAYDLALNRTDGRSTMLVEWADYSKTK